MVLICFFFLFLWGNFVCLYCNSELITLFYANAVHGEVLQNNYLTLNFLSLIKPRCTLVQQFELILKYGLQVTKWNGLKALCAFVCVCFIVPKKSEMCQHRLIAPDCFHPCKCLAIIRIVFFSSSFDTVLDNSSFVSWLLTFPGCLFLPFLVLSLMTCQWLVYWSSMEKR